MAAPPEVVGLGAGVPVTATGAKEGTGSRFGGGR